MHQLLKSGGGLGALDSTTVSGEPEPHVLVVKGKQANRNFARTAWPGGASKYTRFMLYKEVRESETRDPAGSLPVVHRSWAVCVSQNMDTMAALAVVARMVSHNAKTSLFGIAGTKDKRGCTTQVPTHAAACASTSLTTHPRTTQAATPRPPQFATAYMVSAERLAGFNARLQGIRLQPLNYVDRALPLGALRGNAFTVVLRGIDGAGRDEVEALLRHLRDHGFVNYFGLQRFGTGGAPTHAVGAACLRGDWAKASTGGRWARWAGAGAVPGLLSPILLAGPAALSLSRPSSW